MFKRNKEAIQKKITHKNNSYLKILLFNTQNI